MTGWKAFKLKAEEVFEKQHAAEMLKVHKDGVTGFPVKFPLGRSPVLVNLESARKRNESEDVKKNAEKAKEIIGKYQTLINLTAR